MSDIALEFDGVWKKFKQGEGHDSLRDLIPALCKKALGGNRDELDKKEFWALHDVSFQVKRGEALGIIGPNGSGKSTSLKILSGILRPNKGKMQVNGRMSALIEVGAGFHPDLTGRENIYLNGAILGMKRDEISRRLEEIIDFSGISQFIDTPVKRYSSGMYARLGFAIAAHVDPEILLVDEVLSVGDYTFQAKCIKKMEEILANGTTVIFISHNMEAVASLCNKGLLLVHGKVRSEGDPALVINDYYMVGGAWSPQSVTSGKLEITSKRITSAEGDATSIEQGDEVLVELGVVAREDCEVAPGLFLTSGGKVVFDTTYGAMHGEVLRLAKGERVDIGWRFAANLPKGVFSLGLHLEESVNHFHYYNASELVFNVRQSKKYVGDFFLDHALDVHPHFA
ncbi:ABC transporter ATP-binding protein [Geomonas sp. Red32]|uniref:ABC transporter ATP-binding protein n=1 Tax=Geomonas sp. Red32 TaxID=2912856 RepID=UPI00202CCE31|nr:ABC transporter ATP-binding protein [Geomonas sp. Red32]MCM0083360.1 ABC transporter ATP-binding protein [Geomonas sp. Red32]